MSKPSSPAAANSKINFPEKEPLKNIFTKQLFGPRSRMDRDGMRVLLWFCVGFIYLMFMVVILTSEGAASYCVETQATIMEKYHSCRQDNVSKDTCWLYKRRQIDQRLNVACRDEPTAIIIK